MIDRASFDKQIAREQFHRLSAFALSGGSQRSGRLSFTLGINRAKKTYENFVREQYLRIACYARKNFS